MSSLRDDLVRVPRLNTLFLQWGCKNGGRDRELELGDGLPEGMLQGPTTMQNE